MDGDPDVEVVVCMLVDEASKYIHPDSVKRKCSKCFEEIWCMPHNLTKKPMCNKCALEFIKENRNECELAVNKIDVDEAVKFLRELRKGK